MSDLELKVMEMLENLHVRGREMGKQMDAMHERIKLLELAVETQRTTISILCNQVRNARN